MQQSRAIGLTLEPKDPCDHPVTSRFSTRDRGRESLFLKRPVPKVKFLLVLLGVLAALPQGALAQTEKGNIEWGLLFGKEFFTSESRADDDVVLGARIGYGLWKNFEVEVVFDKTTTTPLVVSIIDIEVESLSANFLWNFWTSPQEQAGVYVSGGVGTIEATLEIPPAALPILPTTGWVGNLLPNPATGKVEAGSQDDSDTLLTLAAGVRAFVTDKVAFRYEFRLKSYEVFDVSTEDLEFTFSFSVFHRRK